MYWYPRKPRLAWQTSCLELKRVRASQQLLTLGRYSRRIRFWQRANMNVKDIYFWNIETRTDFQQTSGWTCLTWLQCPFKAKWVTAKRKVDPSELWGSSVFGHTLSESEDGKQCGTSNEPSAPGDLLDLGAESLLWPRLINIGFNYVPARNQVTKRGCFRKFVKGFRKLTPPRSGRRRWFVSTPGRKSWKRGW